MIKRLVASVGIASIIVLGLPIAASAASQTVVDAPTDPIILDVDSTTRLLQVSAAGPVAKATITVDFLSSSGDTCTLTGDPEGEESDTAYPNELSMVLVSPTGTQVTLVSSGEHASYSSSTVPTRTQVTFDDAAAAVVGSTNDRVPESGTFKPASPLSVLVGKAAAGTWTLEFADDAGGDAKCYYSASLTVESGINSTTSISTSATSVAVGAPVTLSAVVADEAQPELTAQSAQAPTGTVTFMAGATTLGSATLDASGAASSSVSFSAAGEQLVTAVYSGDADHAGSTSSAQSIDVYALPATTTTLAASKTALTAGESTTFTATIEPTVNEDATFAPAAIDPAMSGTVQFLNGTTLLGEAAVVDGQATATFPFPAAGAQSITAMYSGDDSFAGSTSAVVVVTVTARAVAPVVPPATTPAKPLANTGSSAPVTGAILWGLGLAAAGLLTAVGARSARRSQTR